MKRAADWVFSFLVMFLLASATTGLIEFTVQLIISGEDVQNKILPRQLALLGLFGSGILLLALMCRIFTVHVLAPSAVQDHVDLLHSVDGKWGKLRSRISRMLEPWSPNTSVWTRAFWWAVSVAAMAAVIVNLWPSMPDAIRDRGDLFVDITIAIVASLGMIREGRAADFQRRDTLGRLVKQSLSSLERQGRSALRELLSGENGPMLVRCYIMQVNGDNLRITWATRRVPPLQRAFRVRSDRGVWGAAWTSQEARNGSPWEGLTPDEEDLLPNELKHVWAIPIIDEGVEEDPKCVGILVLDTACLLENVNNIQQASPGGSRVTSADVAAVVTAVASFHAEQVGEYLALLE